MSQVIDIAYADEVLKVQTTWAALTDIQKQGHLDQAERYFTANYKCSVWTDVDYAIPGTSVLIGATLTDSGADFVTADVVAGLPIRLRGWPAAGNNTVRVVDTVTATVLTFTSAMGLADESSIGIHLAGNAMVKDALAYLAFEDLSGFLYPSKGNAPAASVKRRRSRADVLESETEFFGSSSLTLGSFPYINDLVEPVCTFEGAIRGALERV